MINNRTSDSRRAGRKVGRKGGHKVTEAQGVVALFCLGLIAMNTLVIMIILIARGRPTDYRGPG